ncbi:hypothetical protein AVEN_220482-2-1, partial [Araneus ventricosus]
SVDSPILAEAAVNVPSTNGNKDVIVKQHLQLMKDRDALRDLLQSALTQSDLTKQPHACYLCPKL